MLGMRLSARADYALRAAVELAASSGDHTTAEQLARAQNIPAKFLEAILTQLRRAGLVRSQRGPEGGFWLAKPANAISLADTPVMDGLWETRRADLARTNLTDAYLGVTA